MVWAAAYAGALADGHRPGKAAEIAAEAVASMHTIRYGSVSTSALAYLDDMLGTGADR